MKNNKAYGEGILFTISNYIWCLLQGNLYFILMTIPLWIVLIICGFLGNESVEFVIFLASIPIGPALLALLNVMNKLLKEGDVEVRKQFFKAYRTSFWEGVYYWLLSISILIVIYLDIIYIKVNNGLTVIHLVLLLLGVIVISMMFYIFPIVSIYYLKFSDVIKLSFKYTIKKFNITILNFTLVWAIQFLIMNITSVIVFFIASIFCYFVMSSEQGILYEIEETMIKKNSVVKENIHIESI